MSHPDLASMRVVRHALHKVRKKEIDDLLPAPPTPPAAPGAAPAAPAAAATVTGATAAAGASSSEQASAGDGSSRDGGGGSLERAREQWASSWALKDGEGEEKVETEGKGSTNILKQKSNLRQPRAFAHTSRRAASDRKGKKAEGEGKGKGQWASSWALKEGEGEEKVKTEGKDAEGTPLISALSSRKKSAYLRVVCCKCEFLYLLS